MERVKKRSEICFVKRELNWGSYSAILNNVFGEGLIVILLIKVVFDNRVLNMFSVLIKSIY